MPWRASTSSRRVQLEEQRIAEWAAWRGHIQADVDYNSRRLGDVTTELRLAFDSHVANFDRRMNKQDDALAAVFAETKATNGRVTNLEAEQRAARDVDNAIRAQTAGQTEASRHRMLAVVGLLSGAIAALVSEIVHLTLG